MRLGEKYIKNRGLSLSKDGYIIDETKPNIINGNFIFYHYTFENNLESIFNYGLYAKRPVTSPNLPREFEDMFLIEGFLCENPNWLLNNKYFTNFGMELRKKHIGNILLRIIINANDDNIYIADYAHLLECKLEQKYSKIGLGLEYNNKNGHESTQAYINSYIKLKEYKNHIAPIVQILKKHEGIIIPPEKISLVRK